MPYERDRLSGLRSPDPDDMKDASASSLCRSSFSFLVKTDAPDQHPPHRAGSTQTRKRQGRRRWRTGRLRGRRGRRGCSRPDIRPRDLLFPRDQAEMVLPRIRKPPILPSPDSAGAGFGEACRFADSAKRFDDCGCFFVHIKRVAYSNDSGKKNVRVLNRKRLTGERCGFTRASTPETHCLLNDGDEDADHACSV